MPEFVLYITLTALDCIDNVYQKENLMKDFSLNGVRRFDFRLPSMLVSNTTRKW